MATKLTNEEREKMQRLMLQALACAEIDLGEDDESDDSSEDQGKWYWFAQYLAAEGRKLCDYVRLGGLENGN